MNGCGGKTDTTSSSGIPYTTERDVQYNVYYGTTHNHSNASDGTGTPAEAYAYARDNAGLDFFGLSDHTERISSAEWTTIKCVADSYNSDGNFVTFLGFEWSASDTYGHATILNTSDYCSALSVSSFSKLLNWVNSRDCVVFFNHPGIEDGLHMEFGHFTDFPSYKFVGMELWNKGNGFESYYYLNGPSKTNSYNGQYGYFDEANRSGWLIGACGNDDNHNGTWGTAYTSRFAVLAASKTRAAIFSAFKNRRFYATLDKNLVMSFTVNGYQMGSIIRAGIYDANIQLSDGDGEKFTKVMLYKNGDLLQTWDNLDSIAPNLTYSVTSLVGDYYYIKVTQADGNEAISSPIYVK
jgi:hypothetical protein